MLMLFAMWMTTGDFRRGFNEYDVVFDDPVRGLTEGGEVRFNGIKVGEVESLRIDPDNTNRVIARIRVSADVPVKADTEAQLEPIGLTGVTLIQLSPGSADCGIAAAGLFGAPPPRIQGQGQPDRRHRRARRRCRHARQRSDGGRARSADGREHRPRHPRPAKPREHLASNRRRRIRWSTQSGQAAHEIAALARQMQHDLADLDQVRAQCEPAAERGRPAKRCRSCRSRRKKSAAPQLRSAASPTILEENPSVLTPQAPRPTVELRP